MATDRSTSLPRLPRPQAAGASSTLERLREALRGLQHGEVTVVVQDGVVVQLQRTDRVRVPRFEESEPAP